MRYINLSKYMSFLQQLPIIPQIIYLFIYLFIFYLFSVFWNTFLSYVRGVCLCNSCLYIILVNFKVSFCLLLRASNDVAV